jgi:hypothetical protein
MKALNPQSSRNYLKLLQRVPHSMVNLLQGFSFNIQSQL